MKRLIAFFQRSRVQMILYTVVFFLLIALAMYQIYHVWSVLENTSAGKNIPGSVEPDAQATLLEPKELYLSTDGERYARLTMLSGEYRQLWLVTRTLLTRMGNASIEMEEIREEDLPEDTCGLVLKYACSLEETAIRETLKVELEQARISEILLIPAFFRQEKPTLYLMDWSSERFYRLTSNITGDYRSSRNFSEIFQDLGDRLVFNYLNAHQQYPDRFAGGIYVTEEERGQVLYLPEIQVSFTENGQLDHASAESYCKHFFSHPDVVREVETGEDFVWFADEKRTVRYDSSGLLQYVATQENAEKDPVTVSEAFQLARGFLKEDFRRDPTLLQEVYLSDYTVDGSTYTFYWNYAYNQIPFSMGQDTRLRTDLDSPVEVVVEGSQVRYYHRYMLEKHMEANELFTVGESAVDALDRLLSESGEGASRFLSFGMEYVQRGGFLVLNWYLETPEEERRLMVKEVRI